MWTVDYLGIKEPLERRLAASTESDAARVELAGDLLWYAEMLDALAALHGHGAARGPNGVSYPWFDYDPEPGGVPLTPRLDSATRAVSGAAQLIALGGVPPRAPKTWRDFTDGLLASTSIAEALTGEFVVPAPLAAVDGTAVAGTGMHVVVARNARTLAEWSDYMGNCIAGPYYAGQATKGKSVLTGVYDKDGTLVINAELVARRPTARGWRVEEIKARLPSNHPAQRGRTVAARLPSRPRTGRRHGGVLARNRQPRPPRPRLLAEKHNMARTLVPRSPVTCPEA